MGIINRVLLFFYTIGIALLSLVVIALCLQLVPASYAWNEFLYVCGQWETVAIALVVFLISIQLFGLSVSTAKKVRYDKEAVIIHGEMGDVRVAVEAIRNLVEKTARAVQGVRDVKERVTAQVPKGSPTTDAAVHIELRIVIGKENNVTEISDEIQKRIGDNLQNIIGLKDYKVEIVVADISNAALAKQRVV